jgi:hypothetical protein
LVLSVDLRRVHVATQSDVKSLAVQVVIEFGLAVLLPGGFELGGHDVSAEDIHHHRGNGIRKQVHGFTRFQFQSGLAISLQLQAAASSRDDVHEQSIQLGHGRELLTKSHQD